MNAEIICIGTELLLGSIINSNSSYLSQEMAWLGIDVYRHTTVGDNPTRLSGAIKSALDRSDIVITTGGLGPTVDDITTQTLSDLFASPLVFNKKILTDIKAYFKKKKVYLPKDSLRQALVPKDAVLLPNSLGTAYGLIMKQGNKVLIALPGPPRELSAMFKSCVKPFLKRNFKISSIIKSRLIKTTGFPESNINRKVKRLLRLKGAATVGIYVKPGQVDLNITVKAANERKADMELFRFEKAIRRRLGPAVFGVDDETLEIAAGKLLLKKKKTLAIAESCTGGLLSNRITNVPGSSDYFKFGVVAYSNRIKKDVLGIPDIALRKHGAVSRQVAIAMATNVSAIAKTEIGIGITGIAGPSGATPDKPVGLVYIAIAHSGTVNYKNFYFSGSRSDIKFLSSQAALNMLRHSLTE